MNPSFNPDGWLDIIPYLIAGLPGVIAAYATYYGQQKAKERWAKAEKKSDEIHYEVKNAHNTNLRDDIDIIRSEISAGFTETRKDISGLREELRTERIERIEGDRNK